MGRIEDGIRERYIKLDDEKHYITYVHENKRRNYRNPEEKVQAETYLELILGYGYEPEQIKQFVPVTIDSDTKEADIIVYADTTCTLAHIVVECKREDVSEPEFNQAIKQAFSYAATGTVRARYFWVTSHIKNERFEIPEKEPKKHIRIPDIPRRGVSQLANFKYAKGGGHAKGQQLFDLKPVIASELTRRFKQAHDALWGGQYDRCTEWGLEQYLVSAWRGQCAFLRTKKANTSILYQSVYLTFYKLLVIYMLKAKLVIIPVLSLTGNRIFSLWLHLLRQV